MTRRPDRIVLLVLTATVAAANAAPASAQLIDLQDPILPVPSVTPIQLPDVRDLPIVRDVPVVKELPDVRQLPVVRDVTAPAATPAPTAPAVPGDVAVPLPSTGTSGSGDAPAAKGSSGPSPGGGSASDGGPASGGGSTSSAPSGAGSGTPAGPTAASGSSTTGTRRRAPGAPAKARAARKPPTPVERRERRLRRAVQRLSGCLDALAVGSRWVLVLRAGIGPGAPLSRRAVAQRLDATVRQVATSERRGLRALRGAARAGSCGAEPAATTVTAAPATPPGDASGTTGTAAERSGESADATGKAAPEGRSGVRDEFRSGPAEAPATVVARVAGDGAPILLAVVIAFLAGFGAVWTFERRGGRRSRVA